ncbi:hypothetical protein ASPVEDRAFT_31526 [Aspergillus versicolor CBS 583.65]|uniref:Uncharacterized protein n=1 Tax=Aspergillus versicolor CBS 583.65 TaxID=1036611 RepID=A0A1L9PUG7_ASPVE|nr:uncharacterized protein ASPVEDRAFT_31526 [Aspergillus versicolor CBS 583.65]OJJ05113.1 hypothetical protein ASPVEDRAFT_31526 [Aspergillus versicolor CBS 583.65]
MDSPLPRSFSPLFIPYGPTVANPNKQQPERKHPAYPKRIRPYSPTTVGLPTDLSYLGDDERDPAVDKNPLQGRKIARPTRALKSRIGKTARRESLQKPERTGYFSPESQQEITGWTNCFPQVQQNVESPPYFLSTPIPQDGLPTPPYPMGDLQIGNPGEWRLYQASNGSIWDPKSVDLQSHPTPPRTPSIVRNLSGNESDDGHAADSETMDGDLSGSLHRVSEHIRLLRKTRADSRKQVNRLRAQTRSVNERLRLVTAENAQLYRDAAYERDQRMFFERVMHKLNYMVEQAREDIANALREIGSLEDEVARLKKRPCEFGDEEDRSTKRGRAF